MADTIAGSGRVKSWWWSHTCGYIVPTNGGPDILFNGSSVPVLRKVVAEGEQVTYEAYLGEKGWRATEVLFAPGRCPCCGRDR